MVDTKPRAMIHIELNRELEARITAQAHARGLALEQYIVEKLEASTAPGSQDQYAVSEALRREQAAQRNAAVEAMSRFAAQHGFTNEGADLKAAAHEGHKY